MASTGFWPVKSRLKEVIDYAENPDKTIEKKFLDEDLWSALRYVENEKKTDQELQSFTKKAVTMKMPPKLTL